MANNFIGTAPDQVSVNGMLGSLAFQDATSVMLGKMAAGTVSTANFIRFPNTTVVISAVSNTAITTVGSENHNIGIVGEGVADPNNSTVWGVGVYGKAYTNGATRSGAVTGESHVTNSADTGSAIGVRGYAFDSHTGGLNIGLYGDAANSSIGNYALAMNNGNILSNFSQTWNLNSGNLTFGGNGGVPILSKAPLTINAANYTVLANDYSLIFSTTGCTVVLPTSSTNTGRILNLKLISAITVISSITNVIPLAGGAGTNAIFSAATAGKYTTLQCDGSNWLIMSAN